MQTANTALGKRRRALSPSAAGFCARTWARIKQRTQADSLGSLRLSGVPVTLSLQVVEDNKFFSPRSQPRSNGRASSMPLCLLLAPALPLALAARHRPLRSCLFHAPLFDASTPPLPQLHHPILSTASIRLPIKTNSLPISD